MRLLRYHGELVVAGRNALMRLLLESDTDRSQRWSLRDQGNSIPADARTASTHHTHPETWESAPICSLPFVIFVSPSLPDVYVPGQRGGIPLIVERWLSDEGAC